ncbi:hypothetical protein KY290_013461 [Solanum tuberosum]|uniref:Uncharacterized protein n=1 Tax=Solanum tuberosum TaxID=4113 RepID=A0ABQ7VLS5_SOLTU|nr:hypothetical protein KY289_013581 [Solanum tuberosum]KAH0769480.1 hypothetical protein KY290_013461 [Solanum tuberosum]
MESKWLSSFTHKFQRHSHDWILAVNKLDKEHIVMFSILLDVSDHYLLIVKPILPIGGSLMSFWNKILMQKLVNRCDGSNPRTPEDYASTLYN